MALRAKAPPKRMIDLLSFLKDVAILDVDEAVARKYGELRAALFDAGLTNPDMDLVNAATALVHGLTFVTHNTQDYLNVPGLNITDWMSR